MYVVKSFRYPIFAIGTRKDKRNIVSFEFIGHDVTFDALKVDVDHGDLGTVALNLGDGVVHVADGPDNVRAPRMQQRLQFFGDKVLVLDH